MNSLVVPLFVTIAEQDQAPSLQAWFLILPVVLGLFYFTMIRPAVSDRRKHDQLIGSLKKNDRVVTSGGIIGLFLSVSADHREVTLRVDDNVRLKFHRNYIVAVLNEEKKDSQ